MSVGTRGPGDSSLARTCTSGVCHHFQASGFPAPIQPGHKPVPYCSQSRMFGVPPQLPPGQTVLSHTLNLGIRRTKGDASACPGRAYGPPGGVGNASTASGVRELTNKQTNKQTLNLTQTNANPFFFNNHAAKSGSQSRKRRDLSRCLAQALAGRRQGLGGSRSR